MHKITVKINREKEFTYFTFKNVMIHIHGDNPLNMSINKIDKEAINQFLGKQANFINKLFMKNLLIDFLEYEIKETENSTTYHSNQSDKHKFLPIVVTIPSKYLKRKLPQDEILLEKEMISVLIEMKPDNFIPLHYLLFAGKSSEEIIIALAENHLLNKDGLKQREKLVEKLNQMNLPTAAEIKQREDAKKMKYFEENDQLCITEIIFYHRTKDNSILSSQIFGRTIVLESVGRILNSDEYKAEIEQYQKLNLYGYETLTEVEKRNLNTILNSSQGMPGENWHIWNYREKMPQSMGEILLPYLTEEGRKLELGDGERYESWKKEFEYKKKLEKEAKNQKPIFLSVDEKIRIFNQIDENRKHRKWWQFWK